MAVRNKVSVAVSVLGLILGAGGLSLSAASLASADSTTTVNGCTFETSATTWTLLSNCDSTQQIDLPAGITLDGDNFTISPTFTITDSTNNSAIGIVTANNVTVKDLSIDGSREGLLPNKQGVPKGTLHGINVYVSSGVKIDHVRVSNMGHTGIVVNGSVATVSNVTTINNGWSGIDVDLGLGVTTPATLNIVGPMAQSDAAQIVVDDVRKPVTVNDYLHQYSRAQFGNTAIYTRIFATDKQACKDGGWKLGLSATQSVENQGQCVSHFESDGKSGSGNKKD